MFGNPEQLGRGLAMRVFDVILDQWRISIGIVPNASAIIKVKTSAKTYIGIYNAVCKKHPMLKGRIREIYEYDSLGKSHIAKYSYHEKY